MSSSTWPSLSHLNPIARTPGPPALPLALYLDGVPTTKRDGILGFWLYNVCTRRRHLICVLRKSSLCHCGCRGWCSVHSVWAYLRWSFESMATSFFPAGKHDGTPWEPDTDRKSKAGTPLGFRAMLLQIKGDWLEYCLTAGFPLWSSVQSPCLFCFAPKSGLKTFTGFSPFQSVFPLATPDTYDAECCKAEIRVVLSRGQHRIVKNSLEYKKNQGRARWDNIDVRFGSTGLDARRQA